MYMSIHAHVYSCMETKDHLSCHSSRVIDFLSFSSKNLLLLLLLLLKRSLHIVLAGLELSMEARLASNSRAPPASAFQEQ